LGGRGRQISEFEASLVYRVSPGQPELHRETLSVSKQKTKNKKQKTKKQKPKNKKQKTKNKNKTKKQKNKNKKNPKKTKMGHFLFCLEVFYL
jgi:hypothetical protein